MEFSNFGEFLFFAIEMVFSCWVVYLVGSNVDKAISLIIKGFVKLFKKLVHKK